MLMKCPRCDEEMYFDPDTGRWFCRMRFDGKHGRTHANGWPPAYLHYPRTAKEAAE